MDAEHARIAAAQRRMLELIARADRRRSWVGVGARDTPHRPSMRSGLPDCTAQRWIAAAHPLASLPLVSEALGSGELHLDKAVELPRFATPETESRLLIWAGGVSSGAIRRKADVAARRTRDDLLDVERSRSLMWWSFDEGRRIGLQGELPSAQGALVAKALDRLAKDLPVKPGEEGPAGTEARRADALVPCARPAPGRRTNPTARRSSCTRGWTGWMASSGSARSRTVRRSIRMRRAGSHATRGGRP